MKHINCSNLCGLIILAAVACGVSSARTGVTIDAGHFAQTHVRKRGAEQ
jgi:hypothetical protein